MKAGSEQYDDGNSIGGDGCSSNCMIETNWACGSGNPSYCHPICGNGIITGYEGCDDGNLSPNDGCSILC